MSVGLIIPAFNEAGSIGTVLDAVPSGVLGRELVVVVVDDGSNDGTADVARASGARVLRQPANVGKGCALRRGMSDMKPMGLEAIMWMDSDGQHLPEDIPRIAGPILEGDADMVVGSRYLTSAATRAPVNRRVVRKAAIAAIERITGLTTTDPFSGFRCFSRRAVAALHLTGDCYESELEATLMLSKAGLAIVEVPIPRVYGPCTSKMGYYGALRGRFGVVRGYARTIVAAAADRKESVYG
jgi:glycosyltransferase involved in cell wall biosynthesis